MLCLTNTSQVSSALFYLDRELELSAEPPYTRSVRTVVWEGASAMGLPIPMYAGQARLFAGALRERTNFSTMVKPNMGKTYQSNW